MTDEARGANRTDAGRENAIDDLIDRMEAMEAWKQLEVYKGAARERRVSSAVRYVVTLSIAVIASLAGAFLAAGGHF